MNKFLFIIGIVIVIGCSISTEQSYLLLDRDTTGDLYLFNKDSVLFNSKNGRAYFKKIERGEIMSTYKLRNGKLLLIRPNVLYSYSFENKKYDTVFKSDLIFPFHRIASYDSIIACYGNNVVLYDVEKKKELYKLRGDSFQQNVLLGENESYILNEFNYKNSRLIKFQHQSNEFTVVQNFNNQIPIFLWNESYWTGMLIKNDLLFIQFSEEMIVFHVISNKIINRTNLLQGGTVLKDTQSNFLLFRKETEDELIKYDFARNEFIEI